MDQEPAGTVRIAGPGEPPTAMWRVDPYRVCGHLWRDGALIAESVEVPPSPSAAWSACQIRVIAVFAVWGRDDQSLDCLPYPLVLDAAGVLQGGICDLGRGPPIYQVIFVRIERDRVGRGHSSSSVRSTATPESAAAAFRDDAMRAASRGLRFHMSASARVTSVGIGCSVITPSSSSNRMYRSEEHTSEL